MRSIRYGYVILKFLTPTIIRLELTIHNTNTGPEMNIYKLVFSEALNPSNLLPVSSILGTLPYRLLFSMILRLQCSRAVYFSLESATIIRSLSLCYLPLSLANQPPNTLFWALCTTIRRTRDVMTVVETFARGHQLIKYNKTRDVSL